MNEPETHAAYRRRIMARLDAHLAQCHRERLAREWAAKAQASLPDIEREAIAAEAVSA